MDVLYQLSYSGYFLIKKQNKKRENVCILAKIWHEINLFVFLVALGAAQAFVLYLSLHG